MTKPKRVTWRNDDELQCAILADMGFSTKMIMEETGFTACQVSYRLKIAGIKRRYYRDGTSAMAQRVRQHVPQSNAAIRSILELEIRK